MVKNGALSGLFPTPMISSSKMVMARWMMSRWPRWTGSKTPVYTARRGLSWPMIPSPPLAGPRSAAQGVHQPVDLLDRVIEMRADPQTPATDVDDHPGRPAPLHHLLRVAAGREQRDDPRFLPRHPAAEHLTPGGPGPLAHVVGQ